MNPLTPQDVYEPELVQTIEDRLSERPVLLVGQVGSGSRALARTLVGRATPNVVLDPGTAQGAYELLVADALRQIVAELISPLEVARLDEDSRGAAQARLQVANRFGPDTAEVIAIGQGASATGWSLERVLSMGALPASARVVLLEAHRLTPESALWELRQIAGEAPLQLLLTTRPAHARKLTGPDSAVFGSVWTIELRSPSIDRWAKVLAQHHRSLHPNDLEWLLQRTRGRPATTLAVLAHQEQRTSIRTAWRRAVRANTPRAEDVRRLAGAIHPQAPTLLQAIALSRPPYSYAATASSQVIARTLARLRDLDLIEQPQPRQWEIADPLLSAALALRDPFNATSRLQGQT